MRLRDVADAFGVGTSIAFPPSIDISMDIVEIYDEREGKWVPITKRGKLPGFKQVYRCESNFEDQLIPWGEMPRQCRDGSMPKPLLKRIIDEGELVEKLPSDAEIRNYVLEQLRRVEI